MNILGRPLLAFGSSLASALLLAACSVGGSLPSPASALSAAGRAAFGVPALQPLSVPNVAGTYDGTYSETIGEQTVHGTLVFTIDQTSSKMSGSFDVTVNGNGFNFPVHGTVSSGKKPGAARLNFTIVNVGGGRNAAAKGIVKGGKLSGTAYVPPDGSKAAVSIKYAGTKQ
jgi:hypothetical protein